MWNNVNRIKWSLVQTSEDISKKGNEQTGVEDYLKFFFNYYFKKFQNLSMYVDYGVISLGQSSLQLTYETGIWVP